LYEAFDESSLPFKVDLLDWAATTSSFQDLIRRDGVIIRAASKNEDSGIDSPESGAFLPSTPRSSAP
jgi:hypothetical protein